MSSIKADAKKCMACKACETACSLAHAEAENLSEAAAEPAALPRIKIEADGEKTVIVYCRQCKKPLCVKACKMGALSRADTEDPVLADQDKCVAAEDCVEACPFDAIRLSKDRSMIIKCDLCGERSAEGLGPACVEACPVNALSLK